MGRVLEGRVTGRKDNNSNQSVIIQIILILQRTPMSFMCIFKLICFLEIAAKVI